MPLRKLTKLAQAIALLFSLPLHVPSSWATPSTPAPELSEVLSTLFVPVEKPVEPPTATSAKPPTSAAPPSSAASQPIKAVAPVVAPVVAPKAIPAMPPLSAQPPVPLSSVKAISLPTLKQTPAAASGASASASAVEPVRHTAEPGVTEPVASAEAFKNAVNETPAAPVTISLQTLNEPLVKPDYKFTGQRTAPGLKAPGVAANLLKLPSLPSDDTVQAPIASDAQKPVESVVDPTASAPVAPSSNEAISLIQPKQTGPSKLALEVVKRWAALKSEQQTTQPVTELAKQEPSAPAVAPAAPSEVAPKAVTSVAASAAVSAELNSSAALAPKADAEGSNKSDAPVVQAVMSPSPLEAVAIAPVSAGQTKADAPSEVTPLPVETLSAKVEAKPTPKETVAPSPVLPQAESRDSLAEKASGKELPASTKAPEKTSSADVPAPVAAQGKGLTSASKASEVAQPLSPKASKAPTAPASDSVSTSKETPAIVDANTSKAEKTASAPAVEPAKSAPAPEGKVDEEDAAQEEELKPYSTSDAPIRVRAGAGASGAKPGATKADTELLPPMPVAIPVPAGLTGAPVKSTLPPLPAIPPSAPVPAKVSPPVAEAPAKDSARQNVFEPPKKEASAPSAASSAAAPGPTPAAAPVSLPPPPSSVRLALPPMIPAPAVAAGNAPQLPIVSEAPLIRPAFKDSCRIALSQSTTEVKVSAHDGSRVVKFKRNSGPPCLQAATSGADWLTVELDSRSDEVTLVFEANDTGEARSARVNVVSSAKNFTLFVKQPAL